MPSPADPYGADVLAAASSAAAQRRWPSVPAEPGLLVTHRGSGHGGRVVRCEAGGVVVRGQLGGERSFRLDPGAFAVDGKPVTLVPPRAPDGRPQGGPARTASGSFAPERAAARVARASRLLVEGVHDAALVERVWGDDLRAEGIVVEPLHGVDDLPGVVRAFRPGPDRRLGVLVDHLVAGSKESRLASEAQRAGGGHVLVTGIPYVDIWQAVKPAAVGIRAWPRIPPGRPWKEGVCAALGAGTPADLWRRVLAGCRTWTDVETPLVSAVERLIDFVTEGSAEEG